jgi:hypothetical protein
MQIDVRTGRLSHSLVDFNRTRSRIRAIKLPSKFRWLRTTKALATLRILGFWLRVFIAMQTLALYWFPTAGQAPAKELLCE